MGILQEALFLEAALWGRRAAIRRELVSYAIAGASLWILTHQGPSWQVLACLALSLGYGSWHWNIKVPLAPPETKD